MSMENRNARCSVNVRSKNELYDIICKVSFALDDTRLFLDTHPNCTEAMEYFRKLKQIRHDALKEYTERFGALCAYDMGPEDVWSWNDCNLPWLSNKKGGC